MSWIRDPVMSSDERTVDCRWSKFCWNVVRLYTGANEATKMVLALDFWLKVNTSTQRNPSYFLLTMKFWIQSIFKHLAQFLSACHFSLYTKANNFLFWFVTKRLIMNLYNQTDANIFIDMISSPIQKKFFNLSFFNYRGRKIYKLRKIWPQEQKKGVAEHQAWGAGRVVITWL